MESIVSNFQSNPELAAGLSLIENLQPYQTIIALILGFIILLFGYRIKKITFFIIWFILGFFIATYFMPNIIASVPQIAESSLYQNLIPLGGGLILAMLGFSIEKFCVGGIGFILTMLVTVTYFGTSASVLGIGGIIGIIVAGAAVLLMKPVIIVLTALAGAYAMLFAMLSLVPSIDFNLYYWPILIGLTVAGSIFQFLTTKHR